MRFQPRQLALLALPTVWLTLASSSASAAHNRAVPARAVPASLCTVNLKAQLQAVPLVRVSTVACSTQVYTSSPSQGGRTAVTTYGDPDFSVTLISGYSASFFAGIKPGYETGKKVAIGSWARETASRLGAQVEAEAHHVIVYVSVNGHGTTFFSKYRKVERPLVALAAAVLAQV